MTNNNPSREDIIKMIMDEREHQVSNPNSLDDYKKTKNDWLAAIGYYLFETSSRTDRHVSFEEFRESLIKASAIILAALENSFEHDIKSIIEKLEKNDTED